MCNEVSKVFTQGFQIISNRLTYEIAVFTAI